MTIKASEKYLFGLYSKKLNTKHTLKFDGDYSPFLKQTNIFYKVEQPDKVYEIFETLQFPAEMSKENFLYTKKEVEEIKIKRSLSDIIFGHTAVKFKWKP